MFSAALNYAMLDCPAKTPSLVSRPVTLLNPDAKETRALIPCKGTFLVS